MPGACLAAELLRLRRSVSADVNWQHVNENEGCVISEIEEVCECVMTTC